MRTLNNEQLNMVNGGFILHNYKKSEDCYEVIDDHNGNVLAVVTTFKEAKKIAEQYDMFPMYVSYRELDLLIATGSIFGKK